MKKVLTVLFLLPFFLQAQVVKPAQKTSAKVQKPREERFLINGLIKGLPDSTMIFLTNPAEANNMFAVGYAKKGKFILKGTVQHADVFQLSFVGYQETIEVFLTNDTFNVTGNVSTLKNVAFIGSPAQTDYQQYQVKFDKLKNTLNDLAGRINQTAPSYQRDSLLSLFEAGKLKVIDQVDAFVKQKPASQVSTYIIYVTSPIGGNIADLENRYNRLKPSAKKGYYAQELEKLLAASRIGMEGTMAVDFAQADTANNPVSLSSFKGKYVLVDFWASWCGPCRMENPAVLNAYNAFKNKNFTVFGVSLDQTKEKWVKAINDDKLTWTHVSDLKYWQNAAAQLYHIQSIPANMLIDPTGKIIARNLRGEALYGMLDNLLK